jgi:hypothetical protein
LVLLLRGAGLAVLEPVAHPGAVEAVNAIAPGA